MDFNSLCGGAKFYVLKQTDIPTLQVGKLKSRTAPTVLYNTQPVKTVVNLTVEFPEGDRVFNAVPVNAVVAYEGNEIFSGDAVQMQNVIEDKMRIAKEELDRADYNNTLLAKGNEIIGMINPKFAEECQRQKVIDDLSKRQGELEDTQKTTLSKLDHLTTLIEGMVASSHKELKKQ